MIIKKKNFNLTPGFKGKWPFTVPEIAVVIFRIDKAPQAYAVVHNWGAFALSGLLESHGFAKLEDSGIWAFCPEDLKSFDAGDSKRKSLTPFFEYLEMKTK